MAYKHTNNKGTDYYLHSTEVTLRGSGKIQRIYFFSKKESGAMDDLPEGYMIVENSRTGLPVLKKG
ncbi:MAG: hypothetical protein Q7S88_00040 [Candidatus Daviesbacteria bacterium]|nr:hypothetical protein [Candidatus Daviesbacteria bacterium]